MTIEAVVKSDSDLHPIAARQQASLWSANLIGDARDLFATTNVAETLDVVVDRVQRAFGADEAGILLVTEGGAAATAASGPRGSRADTMQVDHHQGPGLQAIRGRQPVVSADLRFDGRWRVWAPQAADLGLRSVLSLALVDGDPFGVVTLYSERPSFFRTDSLAPGLLFAQQASIAITVAVEREQQLAAADARGVVGQAQGILMERYQITADQAFALIRRSSTAVNQRLRLMAERIIGGLSLPDIDLIARPHLAAVTSIGSGFDHDR